MGNLLEIMNIGLELLQYQYLQSNFCTNVTRTRLFAKNEEN